MEAVNVGSVTWSDEANTRVGWHWTRLLAGGTKEALPDDGRRILLLAHETSPIRSGNGYTFLGQLVLSAEPGDYVARPQMLSELVA